MKNYWKDYSFLYNLDKSKVIFLEDLRIGYLNFKKDKIQPFAICDSDKSLDGSKFLNIDLIQNQKY